ncbi:MAG: UDP-N-acetylmuramoyl-tripeptide--D-alanyl-D-alanine ligase, partial [Planctomycetota bacterium]|nr:UDP-N-acetylmuramoyl-tripeptide--D-alanyl-D-alanine ligase [Planctomycetota bacterium]
HRRDLGLTVIGITGSNGKTTTKEMLKLLLGSRAAASPRSFNNDVGVPLTLLSADRRHEFCIVEIGTNAPGEIAALAAVAEPDIGIVLNVSESHLEGLGSLEGVADEKAALIDALDEDGCAILNHDDPRTRAMAARAQGPVLSFGTWPDADVFGAAIRTIGYRLSFKLLGKRRVSLQLIGVHNVHNALAACAAALWLGEDPYEVAGRLEAYRPVPMRMAVERVGQVRLINDAYNANPRSVRAALQEMSYRAGGRRIAVLGDMLELGTTAESLHADVGRIAAEARIDVVWAIGPMSERIARAARDAGVRHVHWSSDVEAAMAHPPLRVKSRDVVLFKASRAMQFERLYDAVKKDVESRRRGARRGARCAPKGAPSSASKTSGSAT